MRHKRHHRIPVGFWFATLVFLVFSGIGASEAASDLSTVKASGGKKLSSGQIAKMYIGKKIDGQTSRNVRFTNRYKRDGSKVSTVDGKSTTGSWTYNGGRWCETLTSSGKRICDPIIYKLGKTCYSYTPAGKFVAKWGC